MTVETATRTIGLILAPVVMLTACGILVGTMVQHYGAINDRVRSMARERLDLVTGATADPRRDERLAEIDTQLPNLLRRHGLVRRAVVTIYAAVMVFVASMFVIAGAALFKSGPAATVALLVFLTGTGVMLAGVFSFAAELHESHRALDYEANRVSSLKPG